MEEVVLSRAEIGYINDRLGILSGKFDTYFVFDPYEPIPTIIFVASNHIINEYMILQRIFLSNNGILEELNILNNMWHLEYDDLL